MVVLVSIIGALAYTRVFYTPKKAFANNLKEIISKTSDYKPAKFKGVYDAIKKGPIEYDMDIDMVADNETEEEIEGDRNQLETSLTLSMNDDEQEENEDSSSQEEREERSNEESENEAEVEYNEETLEVNNEQTSEEDDFLSNYTWSSASGQAAMQEQESDDKKSVEVNVKTNTTIDYPNRAGNVSADVRATMDEEEYTYLKGNINYKDKVLSVFLEGLHDKSLAVENDNLKDIFKKFGYEDEQLKYGPDSIELMNISDEEIKVFKEKMVNFLKNTLDEFDDSAYSSGSFSEQYGKYISDVYDGRITTLKIPVKTLKSKSIVFIGDVMTDESVLPSLKKTLTKDAKTDFIKYLEKKQKEIEKENDSDMAEISLYVSKNGAYKILIKLEGQNNIEMSEIVDVQNDRVETMVKSSLSKDSEDSTILIPGSTSYVFADFGNANTITKETTYNEEDLEQMLEEYNSKSSVSEDEENDEYAYGSFGEKRKISYYKGMYPNVKDIISYTFNDNGKSLLSGTISISGTKNDKKNAKYDNIKSIKFDIKESDGKNIEKITNDNGIIINKFEKEDFEELKVEILSNIEKYGQENPASWASTISSYISMMRMYSVYSEDEIQNDYTEMSENDIDFYDIDENNYDNNFENDYEDEEREEDREEDTSTFEENSEEDYEE